MYDDSLFLTIKWTESELAYPIINSIGANFDYGGYGRQANGWFGYKIVSSNSPLLEEVNLSNGDILSVSSIEYDGAPLKGFDNDGFPIIDNTILNFHKIELIGFDGAINEAGEEGFGTFIVFQKSATSGIIINTGSMNWCSITGMNGKNRFKIRKITRNMMDKLILGLNVFSD